MPNQQLTDYIKQQIEKGVEGEKIRKILLDTGWAEGDIREAFAAVQDPNYVPMPSAPAKENVRLLKASELLGQAWRLYKDRAWTLIGLALFPIAAMVVFGIIPGAAYVFSKNSFSIIVGFLALYLVAIIAQFWGQIALIYAIKDSQERIGVNESLRRAWPKIVSFWWVGLLSGFIVLGGLFLFIIPGIIFSFWFMFAIYVLVDENIGGMGALLKSKAYAQGQIWNAIGKNLFIFLLYFLMLLPFFIFSWTAPSIFGEEITSIIGGLINLPVQLIALPLLMAYFFLFYKNVKEAKGQFEFKPSGKGWLIFAGIMGLFIIPIFLFIVGMVVINIPSPAPLAAKNATIKGYMAQLRSVAAVHTNNSDGYSYAGLEANSEFSLIRQKIEKASGNSCQAQVSDKSYCVKAKLLGTSSYDEEYYCIDSNGYSNYVPQDYCTDEKPYCAESDNTDEKENSQKLSPAATAAQNSTIKAYMAQLRPTALIYNSSNSSYVGLEGDLNYSTLCQKIRKASGESCQAQTSDTSYCVKAKLLGENSFNEEYWCIDSTGYADLTNENYCTAEKPYCVDPSLDMDNKNK
ncbi:MAG: hypothetical protein WC397_04100 [Candidatus Paceibacterota bacterium]|jgi:hypothetical protein